MVMIDLETSTLAMLVSGLYCTNTNTDPRAIPPEVWIQVVNKLEYFLPMWDYTKITFEQWIETGLFIFPKSMLDEDTLEEMMTDGSYWEYQNGNVVLAINMDIRSINNVE